jgi:hypothetical protein
MTKVTYSRWIPYDHETVYNVLTDLDVLPQIVNRINSIEVIERDGNVGKVNIKMDLPARIVVDSAGEVEGVPHERLSFRTQDPFPIQFAWTLTPKTQNGTAGTELVASLNLGIKENAFANMIIKNVMSAELNGDVDRLVQWLKTHPVEESAA